MECPFRTRKNAAETHFVYLYWLHAQKYTLEIWIHATRAAPCLSLRVLAHIAPCRSNRILSFTIGWDFFIARRDCLSSLSAPKNHLDFFFFKIARLTGVFLSTIVTDKIKAVEFKQPPVVFRPALITRGRPKHTSRCRESSQPFSFSRWLQKQTFRGRRVVHFRGVDVFRKPAGTSQRSPLTN